MRIALITALLVGCEAGRIDLGKDDPAGDDTATLPIDDTGDSGDTSDTDTEDTAVEPPPPDWTVDCDGAGDFTTIQEAIDAATSGDRIALMPCEYHERIDYVAKYLDIYGIEGSGRTTIDADGTGTVVNVETGESPGTRLAGVTVRGGYDNAAGSAIEVYNSALELDDVVLEGNGESHAVLYASVGWIRASYLTIRDNEVMADGMAIVSDGGSLTGDHLDVDCDGGAYALWQHNASNLDQSSFSCDAGYGFYSYHGEVRARRSSFSGGIAGIYAFDQEDSPSERALLSNISASGAVGVQIEYMTLEMENSVVWGTDAAVSVLMNSSSSWIWNSVLLNATCGITGDAVALSTGYTNFWNNTTDVCTVIASVSLSVDPEFVNFPDDLHLAAGSPLINAGEPSWDDADGTRSDVGLYGGPESEW